LGIATTMLINVVLARWLSPDDFGLFLLLSSGLGFASLLAMFGLSVAIVRFVPESLGRGDPARARQAMGLIGGVALVTIGSTAALVALGLAYWGTALFELPDVPAIVPMVAVGVVLLALSQLTGEAFRSLHELRLASLFSGGQAGGLLSSMVFLVLMSVAIVLGKPSFLTALALNLVAMSVSLPLAALGLLQVSRAQLAVAPGVAATAPIAMSELLRFCLPMLVIQLLTCVSMQADLWIAGAACPHNQLALYGAARRVMLLVSMPLQMVNLTVMASIAELHGQQRLKEIESLLRGAASWAAWPSSVAIVVLLVAGGPVLELLFGPYFRQAAGPLRILAVGQLFLVCAGAAGYALEMTGRQMCSLLVNLLDAVAMVALGTWAATHYGIVGLALASTAVVAAHSIVIWVLARRLVGVWTHPTVRLGLLLKSWSLGAR
jgi:O-antigen/teichoic acid export membrane protein